MKEKNAIIWVTTTRKVKIQDIADYVGDSLALAQWAAKTEADIIVNVWCSLYGRNGQSTLSG